MNVLAAVAWTCFGLAAYHYVVYPLAVIALARLTRGRSGAPSPAHAALPRVALVIAAYNEERVIRAKLDNCRALSYPRELLTVIVAADGSSDRTADIVRELGDPRVIVLHEPERRGKGAALNRAVAASDADVVVLSDANNFYSVDAIERLVARLEDPGVGGVTGAKKIFEARERAAAAGDGLYWRYESLIKTAESRLGGTVAADGEIFALRRAQYAPIPRHVVNDDMHLTLRLVERGLRLVYEPTATASEEGSFTIREDFNVKVRMIAGGLQNTCAEWRTVFGSGAFTFKYLSHKILRWLMPLFMLGLLVSSALLARTTPYNLLFAAQLFFYGLAALGWWLNARGQRGALFYVPFYFVAMNAAAAGGLLRFLRGSQTPLWTKAAR